jgi:serpin B
MMQQEVDVAYFETQTLQIVDLPYGDSLYSMSIIVPKSNQSVDSLVESLSVEDWSFWMSNLRTTPIRLFLPRFTTTYDALLNDVLIEMGMADAFDPAVADFSAMSPNARALGMHISQVLHKTFVEVNEEGTEAAAVTAVVVELTSVGGGKPLVRVDRPFVFFIRERHTGTILFAGKVVDLS